MTPEEQIRRILDEWRTVSETHKDALVRCLADTSDPLIPGDITAILNDIINQRGDMT